MKKLLIPMLLIGLLFSLTSVGLANFNDSPKANHWAYENFQVLYKAGLLKGYPDGIFKGEQAATRYEMVEMTGRVLKHMEAKVDVAFGETKYLTEAEVKTLIADSVNPEVDLDAVYEAIQNLEDEFLTELINLELRVTTLHTSVAGLKAEIGSLTEESAALKSDVEALQAEIAALKEGNIVKDQEIAKTQKDAKTGKVLGIIGIATGIVAGVLGIIF